MYVYILICFVLRVLSWIMMEMGIRLYTRTSLKTAWHDLGFCNASSFKKHAGSAAEHTFKAGRDSVNKQLPLSSFYPRVTLAQKV